MIKMSESDLYLKEKELQNKITELSLKPLTEDNKLELAKLVGVYQFIEYELLGE